MVTIVRWLVELRNKVSKDGPVILKERVFFTLSKAKSNRAEQPLERVHEQLAGLLAAHEAPFSIKLLDTGVNMEVASAELGAWLKSPAFAPLLHLVQGASARRLTSDQLLHEDSGVQMRWAAWCLGGGGGAAAVPAAAWLAGVCCRARCWGKEPPWRCCMRLVLC
jgi:pentatricopeptide repeat domain-containing protein 1